MLSFTHSKECVEDVKSDRNHCLQLERTFPVKEQPGTMIQEKHETIWQKDLGRVLSSDKLKVQTDDQRSFYVALGNL